MIGCTKLMLVAVALALTMGAAISPSYAYGDAPWCAVVNIGTGEMYWDCQYQTFDACWPNVIAGNRGFCNVNPTYKPAVAAPATHHVRRHAAKHS